MAILALDDYNGIDIEAWSRSNGVQTLYDRYLQLSDENEQNLVAPDDMRLGPWIEVISDLIVLRGMPLTIAMFADQSGLLYIGDQAGFNVYDLEVSTHISNREKLLAAVFADEQLTHREFHVYSDNRAGADRLHNRDWTVSLNCALTSNTNVFYVGVYSGQQKRPGENRRHSVTYAYVTQSNWDSAEQDGTTEPAWQKLTAESVSWKASNNKYSTDHYFRYAYGITSTTSYSPLEPGTWEFANTARIVKSGKEVTFNRWVMLPYTNSTTDPRRYGVLYVSPGTGESGHWTSHQGMGNGNFIRLTCQ